MTVLQRHRLIRNAAVLNGVLLIAALLYAIIGQTGLGTGLLRCRVMEHLGVYCPGCGGSRAVMALLRLDLAGCFFYSPFVFTAFMLLLGADLSVIAALIENDPTPVRRFNLNWLLVLPAVLILTCLVRNVLLLGFGIDLLGDRALFYHP